MNAYNGHRSWNQWNATLWLSNDENLEMILRVYKDKNFSDAKIFNQMKSLIGDKTPDGATINAMALRTFIKER